MSEAKHTSGPWRVVDAPGRGPEVHWGPAPTDEGTNIHRPVCHMRWTDGLRPEVEATVAADAKLIAAAPELLAACEAVIEAFTNDYIPDTRKSNAMLRVRAAIAKAKATP